MSCEFRSGSSCIGFFRVYGSNDNDSSRSCSSLACSCTAVAFTLSAMRHSLEPLYSMNCPRTSWSTSATQSPVQQRRPHRNTVEFLHSRIPATDGTRTCCIIIDAVVSIWIDRHCTTRPRACYSNHLSQVFCWHAYPTLRFVHVRSSHPTDL